MLSCKLGLTSEEIEALLASGDIERCEECSLLKMEDGIIHCPILDNNTNNK